jgi:hypothetical protein
MFLNLRVFTSHIFVVQHVLKKDIGRAYHARASGLLENSPQQSTSTTVDLLQRLLTNQELRNPVNTVPYIASGFTKPEDSQQVRRRD